MVSWKSPGSSDRLLAAILAANPNLKFNYQAIAAYYGEGVSANAIEKRIGYHRGEARKLIDPEEGYDEPGPGSARRSNPNLTPRTPRVNRRTPRKVTFARNKKGCFSPSESDTEEEDTPSKKPKVESIGSNASDPICLLDSDNSLPARGRGRARVAWDNANGSSNGFAVKNEERENPWIKQQPVTPPSVFTAPSSSALYSSVSSQSSRANGPFQYVDDGDDNDIFVDQKRETDETDYPSLGDYFRTRLAAFGTV